MKINATFKDDTDFPRIAALAETASKEALSKACRIIAAEARRRAPVGLAEERSWKEAHGGTSPELRKSIRSSVSKNKLIDGLFSGDVRTTDGTGALIELGTGLYGRHGKPIVPRKRPYMTFIWPAGGIGVFRMKRIRGRKGTPFLGPALRAKAGVVIEALKDGLDR